MYSPVYNLLRCTMAVQWQYNGTHLFSTGLTLVSHTLRAHIHLQCSSIHIHTLRNVTFTLRPDTHTHLSNSHTAVMRWYLHRDPSLLLLLLLLLLHSSPPLSLLLLLCSSLLLQVEAHYGAKVEEAWFPGTVEAVNDAEGTCDVRYDDGDKEAGKPWSRVRAAAVDGDSGSARGRKEKKRTKRKCTLCGAVLTTLWYGKVGEPPFTHTPLGVYECILLRSQYSV